MLPGGVAAGNGSDVVMWGAAARRTGRFDRPRRQLRACGVQLLFAVAGLGLGLLLPRITTEPTVASSRVAEALIGVGFGVLGLVSIIFSLLFLVVQWAFSSLSPRLNLFRDDPIVWRTFGLAIGVFVFSVTAALVIGNDPTVSVIVPVAEVVAVLAALAMIRALQVKAFAFYPAGADPVGHRGTGPRHPRRPVPPAWASRHESRNAAATAPDRHLAGPAGHLAATQPAPAGPCSRDCGVIVLRARIGDTLQEGAVVADLHGGDAGDAAVLGALVTGPERTFHQDPRSFRVPAAGRHRPAGTVPGCQRPGYRRPGPGYHPEPAVAPGNPGPGRSRHHR